MVNRLQNVLPKLIDNSQSAFVKGRMNFDNIMVAHETIHAMRFCKNGKISYLAAKLDISKAYDRIEWSYLEGGSSIGWVIKTKSRHRSFLRYYWSPEIMFLN